MKKIENMTLEESMAALEEIVAKLEGSEISLDKSIEVFETGMKLAAHSRVLLDDYIKRISVLKKENGELKETEFDTVD